MNRVLPRAALIATLSLPAWLAGCDQGNDAQTPAGQAAQSALGVQNTEGTEKTIETQRNVTVIETKKVVDNKTGEVIEDEKTITPVTVTKQKEVTTDVDVNVGESVKTDQR